MLHARSTRPTPRLSRSTSDGCRSTSSASIEDSASPRLARKETVCASRYFVDVYGQAPRIELFTRQDNLQKGPVPYGAPTHSQILEVITPQEFRSPVMDFSAIMRWLGDKAKDKK